jgi:AcrR family transcriptional regulator
LTSADCPTTPPPTRRKNDPEGMRQRILDAAQNEFVQHGFSGARLDNIAEQANTNKRMVVYHFHSKKELYIAVLERVYGEIRDIEKQLQLEACHRVKPWPCSPASPSTTTTITRTSAGW